MLIMLNLTPVFLEEKIHFSDQKSLANLKTFINFATESSHCSTIGSSEPPLPFPKGEGLGVGFATSKF